MSLPENFLVQFRARASTFIETGSHRGDGIAAALEAGYVDVYSTEIEPFSYGWCSHRFQDDHDRVHLFLRDSREFLFYLLKYTTSPAVFWLDAHWCGGNGELEGKDTAQPGDPPLLQEIQIIGDHELSHVILIDDVRLFGDELPSLEEVTSLLEANGYNRLRRVDSLEFKDDILVAEKET